MERHDSDSVQLVKRSTNLVDPINHESPISFTSGLAWNIMSLLVHNIVHTLSRFSSTLIINQIDDLPSIHQRMSLNFFRTLPWFKAGLHQLTSISKTELPLIVSMCLDLLAQFDSHTQNPPQHHNKNKEFEFSHVTQSLQNQSHSFIFKDAFHFCVSDFLVHVLENYNGKLIKNFELELVEWAFYNFLRSSDSDKNSDNVNLSPWAVETIDRWADILHFMTPWAIPSLNHLTDEYFNTQKVHDRASIKPIIPLIKGLFKLRIEYIDSEIGSSTETFIKHLFSFADYICTLSNSTKLSNLWATLFGNFFQQRYNTHLRYLPLIESPPFGLVSSVWIDTNNEHNNNNHSSSLLDTKGNHSSNNRDLLFSSLLKELKSYPKLKVIRLYMRRMNPAFKPQKTGLTVTPENMNEYLELLGASTVVPTLVNSPVTITPHSFSLSTIAPEYQQHLNVPVDMSIDHIISLFLRKPKLSSTLLLCTISYAPRTLDQLSYVPQDKWNYQNLSALLKVLQCLHNQPNWVQLVQAKMNQDKLSHHVPQGISNLIQRLDRILFDLYNIAKQNEQNEILKVNRKKSTRFSAFSPFSSSGSGGNIPGTCANPIRSHSPGKDRPNINRTESPTRDRYTGQPAPHISHAPNSGSGSFISRHGGVVSSGKNNTIGESGDKRQFFGQDSSTPPSSFKFPTVDSTHEFEEENSLESSNNGVSADILPTHIYSLIRSFVALISNNQFVSFSEPFKLWLIPETQLSFVELLLSIAKNSPETRLLLIHSLFELLVSPSEYFIPPVKDITSTNNNTNNNNNNNTLNFDNPLLQLLCKIILCSNQVDFDLSVLAKLEVVCILCFCHKSQTLIQLGLELVYHMRWATLPSSARSQQHNNLHSSSNGLNSVASLHSTLIKNKSKLVKNAVVRIQRTDPTLYEKFFLNASENDAWELIKSESSVWLYFLPELLKIYALEEESLIGLAAAGPPPHNIDALAILYRLFVHSMESQQEYALAGPYLSALFSLPSFNQIDYIRRIINLSYFGSLLSSMNASSAIYALQSVQFYSMPILVDYWKSVLMIQGYNQPFYLSCALATFTELINAHLDRFVDDDFGDLQALAPQFYSFNKSIPNITSLTSQLILAASDLVLSGNLTKLDVLSILYVLDIAIRAIGTLARCFAVHNNADDANTDMKIQAIMESKNLWKSPANALTFCTFLQFGLGTFIKQIFPNLSKRPVFSSSAMGLFNNNNNTAQDNTTSQNSKAGENQSLNLNTIVEPIYSESINTSTLASQLPTQANNNSIQGKSSKIKVTFNTNSFIPGLIGSISKEKLVSILEKNAMEAWISLAQIGVLNMINWQFPQPNNKSSNNNIIKTGDNNNNGSSSSLSQLLQFLLRIDSYSNFSILKWILHYNLGSKFEKSFESLLFCLLSVPEYHLNFLYALASHFMPINENPLNKNHLHTTSSLQRPFQHHHSHFQFAIITEVVVHTPDILWNTQESIHRVWRMNLPRILASRMLQLPIPLLVNLGCLHLANPNKNARRISREILRIIFSHLAFPLPETLQIEATKQHSVQLLENHALLTVNQVAFTLFKDNTDSPEVSAIKLLDQCFTWMNWDSTSLHNLWLCELATIWGSHVRPLTETLLQKLLSVTISIGPHLEHQIGLIWGSFVNPTLRPDSWKDDLKTMIHFLLKIDFKHSVVSKLLIAIYEVGEEQANKIVSILLGILENQSIRQTSDEKDDNSSKNIGNRSNSSVALDYHQAVEALLYIVDNSFPRLLKMAPRIVLYCFINHQDPIFALLLSNILIKLSASPLVAVSLKSDMARLAHSLLTPGTSRTPMSTNFGSSSKNQQNNSTYRTRAMTITTQPAITTIWTEQEVPPAESPTAYKLFPEIIAPSSPTNGNQQHTPTSMSYYDSGSSSSSWWLKPETYGLPKCFASVFYWLTHTDERFPLKFFRLCCEYMAKCSHQGLVSNLPNLTTVFALLRSLVDAVNWKTKFEDVLEFTSHQLIPLLSELVKHVEITAWKNQADDLVSTFASMNSKSSLIDSTNYNESFYIVEVLASICHSVLKGQLTSKEHSFWTLVAMLFSHDKNLVSQGITALQQVQFNQLDLIETSTFGRIPSQIWVTCFTSSSKSPTKSDIITFDQTLKFNDSLTDILLYTLHRPDMVSREAEILNLLFTFGTSVIEPISGKIEKQHRVLLAGVVLFLTWYQTVMGTPQAHHNYTKILTQNLNNFLLSFLTRFTLQSTSILAKTTLTIYSKPNYTNLVENLKNSLSLYLTSSLPSSNQSYLSLENDNKDSKLFAVISSLSALTLPEEADYLVELVTIHLKSRSDHAPALFNLIRLFIESTSKSDQKYQSKFAPLVLLAFELNYLPNYNIEVQLQELLATAPLLNHNNNLINNNNKSELALHLSSSASSIMSLGQASINSDDIPTLDGNRKSPPSSQRTHSKKKKQPRSDSSSSLPTASRTKHKKKGSKDNSTPHKTQPKVAADQESPDKKHSRRKSSRHPNKTNTSTTTSKRSKRKLVVEEEIVVKTTTEDSKPVKPQLKSIIETEKTRLVELIGQKHISSRLLLLITKDLVMQSLIIEPSPPPQQQLSEEIKNDSDSKINLEKPVDPNSQSVVTVLGSPTLSKSPHSSVPELNLSTMRQNSIIGTRGSHTSLMNRGDDAALFLDFLTRQSTKRARHSVSMMQKRHSRILKDLEHGWGESEELLTIAEEEGGDGLNKPSSPSLTKTQGKLSNPSSMFYNLTYRPLPLDTINSTSTSTKNQQSLLQNNLYHLLGWNEDEYQQQKANMNNNGGEPFFSYDSLLRLYNDTSTSKRAKQLANIKFENIKQNRPFVTSLFGNVTSMLQFLVKQGEITMETSILLSSSPARIGLWAVVSITSPAIYLLYLPPMSLRSIINNTTNIEDQLLLDFDNACKRSLFVLCHSYHIFYNNSEMVQLLAANNNINNNSSNHNTGPVSIDSPRRSKLNHPNNNVKQQLLHSSPRSTSPLRGGSNIRSGSISNNNPNSVKFSPRPLQKQPSDSSGNWSDSEVAKDRANKRRSKQLQATPIKSFGSHQQMISFSASAADFSSLEMGISPPDIASSPLNSPTTTSFMPSSPPLRRSGNHPNTSSSPRIELRKKQSSPLRYVQPSGDLTSTATSATAATSSNQSVLLPSLKPFMQWWFPSNKMSHSLPFPKISLGNHSWVATPSQILRQVKSKFETTTFDCYSRKNSLENLRISSSSSIDKVSTKKLHVKQQSGSSVNSTSSYVNSTIVQHKNSSSGTGGMVHSTSFDDSSVDGALKTKNSPYTIVRSPMTEFLLNWKVSNGGLVKLDPDMLTNKKMTLNFMRNIFEELDKHILKIKKKLRNQQKTQLSSLNVLATEIVKAYLRIKLPMENRLGSSIVGVDETIGDLLSKTKNSSSSLPLSPISKSNSKHTRTTSSSSREAAAFDPSSPSFQTIVQHFIPLVESLCNCDSNEILQISYFKSVWLVEYTENKRVSKGSKGFTNAERANLVEKYLLDPKLLRKALGKHYDSLALNTYVSQALTEQTYSIFTPSIGDIFLEEYNKTLIATVQKFLESQTSNMSDYIKQSGKSSFKNAGIDLLEKYIQAFDRFFGGIDTDFDPDNSSINNSNTNSNNNNNNNSLIYITINKFNEVLLNSQISSSSLSSSKPSKKKSKKKFELSYTQDYYYDGPGHLYYTLQLVDPSNGSLPIIGQLILKENVEKLLYFITIKEGLCLTFIYNTVNNTTTVYQSDGLFSQVVNLQKSVLHTFEGQVLMTVSPNLRFCATYTNNSKVIDLWVLSLEAGWTQIKKIPIPNGEEQQQNLKIVGIQFAGSSRIILTSKSIEERKGKNESSIEKMFIRILSLNVPNMSAVLPVTASNDSTSIEPVLIQSQHKTKNVEQFGPWVQIPNHSKSITSVSGRYLVLLDINDQKLKIFDMEEYQREASHHNIFYSNPGNLVQPSSNSLLITKPNINTNTNPIVSDNPETRSSSMPLMTQNPPNTSQEDLSKYQHIHHPQHQMQQKILVPIHTLDLYVGFGHKVSKVYLRLLNRQIHVFGVSQNALHSLLIQDLTHSASNTPHPHLKNLRSSAYGKRSSSSGPIGSKSQELETPHEEIAITGSGGLNSSSGSTIINKPSSQNQLLQQQSPPTNVGYLESLKTTFLLYGPHKRFDKPFENFLSQNEKSYDEKSDSCTFTVHCVVDVSESKVLEEQGYRAFFEKYIDWLRYTMTPYCNNNNSNTSQSQTQNFSPDLNESTLDSTKTHQLNNNNNLNNRQVEIKLLVSSLRAFQSVPAPVDMRAIVNTGTSDSLDFISDYHILPTMDIWLKQLICLFPVKFAENINGILVPSDLISLESKNRDNNINNEETIHTVKTPRVVHTDTLTTPILLDLDFPQSDPKKSKENTNSNDNNRNNSNINSNDYSTVHSKVLKNSTLLSFGPFLPILLDWNGPIKVLTSMGGTPRHAVLNNVIGTTLFDQNRRVKNPSIYLTICEYENCLYVILDLVLPSNINQNSTNASTSSRDHVSSSIEIDELHHKHHQDHQQHQHIVHDISSKYLSLLATCISDIIICHTSFLMNSFDDNFLVSPLDNLVSLFKQTSPIGNEILNLLSNPKFNSQFLLTSSSSSVSIHKNSHQHSRQSSVEGSSGGLIHSSSFMDFAPGYQTLNKSQSSIHGESHHRQQSRHHHHHHQKSTTKVSKAFSEISTSSSSHSLEASSASSQYNTSSLSPFSGRLYILMGDVLNTMQASLVAQEFKQQIKHVRESHFANENFTAVLFGPHRPCLLCYADPLVTSKSFSSTVSTLSEDIQSAVPQYVSGRQFLRNLFKFIRILNKVCSNNLNNSLDTSINQGTRSDSEDSSSSSSDDSEVVESTMPQFLTPIPHSTEPIHKHNNDNGKSEHKKDNKNKSNRSSSSSTASSSSSHWSIVSSSEVHIDVKKEQNLEGLEEGQSQINSKNIVDFLLSKLDYAAQFGSQDEQTFLTVYHLDDQSNKSLNSEFIPDTAIEIGSIEIPDQNFDLALFSNMTQVCQWLKLEAGVPANELYQEIIGLYSYIVKRRFSRVSSWLSQNLKYIDDAESDNDKIETLMQLFEQLNDKYTQIWQPCGEICSKCARKCSLPKSHKATNSKKPKNNRNNSDNARINSTDEHDCCNDHLCGANCSICLNEPCSHPFGHTPFSTSVLDPAKGEEQVLHLCSKLHQCTQPCQLAPFKLKGCTGTCSQYVVSQSTSSRAHQHQCNGVHSCNQYCEPCGKSCKNLFNEPHILHSCGATKCFEICQVTPNCSRPCSLGHHHLEKHSCGYKHS